MNIKRTKLIPTYYKVQAFCECGEEMEYTGQINDHYTGPPTYQYICMKCKNIEELVRQYPYIDTIYKEFDPTKPMLDGSEVTTEYLNDR